MQMTWFYTKIKYNGYQDSGLLSEDLHFNHIWLKLA